MGNNTSKKQTGWIKCDPVRLSTFSNIVCIDHDTLLIGVINYGNPHKNKPSTFGIWKYIVSTNKWSRLFKEYQCIKSQCVSCSIYSNQMKNNLYLYLCARSGDEFKQFHIISVNLKTLEWDAISSEFDYNITPYMFTKCIMINDELHIMNQNQHYIFNTKTKQYKKIYDHIYQSPGENIHFIPWDCWTHLVYLKNKHILMQTLDISHNMALFSYDFGMNRWEKNEKLYIIPQSYDMISTKDEKYIITFGSTFNRYNEIFIIHTDTNNIYKSKLRMPRKAIHNLSAVIIDNYQWSLVLVTAFITQLKLKKDCESDIIKLITIMYADQYIHFMKRASSGNDNHWKISLSELLDSFTEVDRLETFPTFDELSYIAATRK